LSATYRHNAGSLRTLGTLCQVLLALFMAVSGVLAALSLVTAAREMREGFSMHLFTLPLYASMITLAFIPAALALSVWVWRAHANLHADRLEALRFTPPWAALSLWVPVANLYVPKGAMRQLWNHSHGEEPWFADQSVDKINAWWTCYVVGIVIMTALTAFALLDRFSNLAILTPPGTNSAGFAFASALLAVSAGLLLQITTAITRAQQTVVAVGNTFD
jgi:hypothetical protein